MPCLPLGGRLGPLDAKNEMVVAEPVERGDRLGCVLLPAEIIIIGVNVVNTGLTSSDGERCFVTCSS